MEYDQGEISKAKAEFAVRLQEIRIKSGNPSYRDIIRLSDRNGYGGYLSPSSLSRLLNGEGWPRWQVVEAFLLGCDADRDTVKACTEAWEKLIGLRAADQMSAKRPAGTDCAECGAYIPTENTGRHRDWHARLAELLSQLPALCVTTGA